jgi:prepilin-type N-terminal cleavage/methylation domain-containing protein
MNNKKGFSLVELAIGLAVVTTLVVAVSVSSGLRDSAKVQSASNSVRTLRTAAENYLANGNLNFSAVSIANLQKDSLLPANFSGTGSNPWGGNFAITVNSGDSSKCDVILTGLNKIQSDKLTAAFNSNAASIYDAGKQTWTVTF